MLTMSPALPCGSDTRRGIFHLEISFGAFRVAQALVDSQEQPTRYRRFVIRTRAYCEWLRDIVVAQTPDQRAVARVTHGVLMNQIPEAARETVRAERAAVGMFFIGGIRDGPGGGQAQLFTGAEIDLGVYPLFGCVDINLVGSDVGGVCLKFCW
jgi:hypothetical protein